MPEISKLSLNAGELSDELAGRIDLNKFNSGCEVLENARVLRAGGVTRRAGLRYLGVVNDENRKTRLVGFRFSEEQGYVLELSHYTMRVIHAGEIQPTVYATPWSEDQVFSLQFAQRIDRVIVTHPQVPVYNILRFNDGTWGVEEFPWQGRVWELFPTTDSFTMAAAATTGSTTITASADIFGDTWVGDRIRIDHTVGEVNNGYLVSDAVATSVVFNPATQFGQSFTYRDYAVDDIVYETVSGVRNYYVCIQLFDGSEDHVPGNNSPEDYPQFFQPNVVLVPPTEVAAGWVFETFGTWNGSYAIQRSFNDGASWDTIKIVSSEDNRNERVEDSEDEAAMIRVLVTAMADVNERVEFVVNSYTSTGSALVTAVNSPTEVAVTVEEEFESVVASGTWFEEAFSPRNGYPSGVTFYQSRLCFGGTSTRPQTLWLSQTKRPFDFTNGTLATDGMSFETDAEGYEAITWLSSHLSLLVGTTLGVWAIAAPDGSSLTPENNSINRQMQIGAQPGFQAAPLQNNILFLQYKGRKIQELTGGSVEYGGYLSSDVTQLATHVTRGGVTQMAVGELPDSTLLLINNGELPVLTYERSQNVVGWARWLTQGAFESVAVTSGGGEEDDHYFVVNRDGRRFIEYFTPDMLRVEELNDSFNLRFLDCYTERIEAEPFDTVEGLERFEGQEVQIFLDGEPHGSGTVAGGEIVLPRLATNVVVGLPYTTEVRPMPIDFGAIGSKSSMMEILIRFRNTLGGEVSQDRKNWSVIDQMKPTIVDGKPFSLLSEDAQATPHSTWSRKPSISIRQAQALPMTILAMRIKTKSSS